MNVAFLSSPPVELTEDLVILSGDHQTTIKCKSGMWSTILGVNFEQAPVLVGVMAAGIDNSEFMELPWMRYVEKVPAGRFIGMLCNEESSVPLMNSLKVFSLGADFLFAADKKMGVLVATKDSLPVDYTVQVAYATLDVKAPIIAVRVLFNNNLKGVSDE